MLACEILEADWQPQIRQPDRDLIGLEHPMRQLDVEQPVVDVRRTRPFPIEQKALFRLFPQDAMLHRELGVRHLDLLDAVERQSFERLPKLVGRVVPEDDPVLVKLGIEPFGDAVIHAQSSASERPLMGFSAAPNFG